MTVLIGESRRVLRIESAKFTIPPNVFISIKTTSALTSFARSNAFFTVRHELGPISSLMSNRYTSCACTLIHIHNAIRRNKPWKITRHGRMVGELSIVNWVFQTNRFYFWGLRGSILPAAHAQTDG